MNRNFTAGAFALGLTISAGCRTGAPEIQLKPATPSAEAQPELKNILSDPNLSKLLEGVNPGQLDHMLPLVPKPQP